MRVICRFEFKVDVDNELIESQIASAIRIAEYLFDQPRVRLNASYLTSKNKAAIDVTDEVGEHVAMIFIGFMTDKVGEDKFTMDRVKED